MVILIPLVHVAFIHVLLFMVSVPRVLPLSLAYRPMQETPYDHSALVDYDFPPHSGLRTSAGLMNNPFPVEKRKNEFIRFGKRKDDFMRFNKRKNEFIRFGKRFGALERW